MKQRAKSTVAAIVGVALVAAVTGCDYPGQNRYYANTVGYPIPVQFGTVVASRPIQIKGSPSGFGPAVAGAAGGLGGSTIGAGTGAGLAALGLAVVGIALGAIAEQSAIDRNGVEYTVVTQSGQVFTLAQNLNKGDTIIEPGHRVMVQSGYGYMRVLPADSIPPDMQRPQGITIH